MPNLCSVQLVASGHGHRKAWCTVFDAGQQRLVSGAIMHEKGEGHRSMFSGPHLVDIARRALASPPAVQVDNTHYDMVPVGVTVLASINLPSSYNQVKRPV